MKLSPEFLQLKRQLLDRIRDTSGMKTDLDLLDKLNRSVEGVATGAIE
jgi:NitT/TauT family transport system ATP-binding protein